jgi:hypothetical protein
VPERRRRQVGIEQVLVVVGEWKKASAAVTTRMRQ